MLEELLLAQLDSIGLRAHSSLPLHGSRARAGFLAPLLWASLTENNRNEYSQWRCVFVVNSGNLAERIRRIAVGQTRSGTWS